MAGKKKTNHTEIISNNDLPAEPIKAESAETTPSPKIGFTRREVLQIGEPNANLTFKRIEVLQI